MSDLRVVGIFTPWAEVICYTCHGNDIMGRSLPAKRFEELCTPREKDDSGSWGEGAGTCDKCDCAVWVRRDIAELQCIQELTGGAMQQTGGMCAALHIGDDLGSETSPLICITAMDGAIYIGQYSSAIAMCDGSEPIGWKEVKFGDYAFVNRVVTGMGLPTIDTLMDLATKVKDVDGGDLNDCCKVVQDALGVTCGGLAGMMLDYDDYSKDNWWQIFGEYVNAEWRGVIDDTIEEERQWREGEEANS